MINLPPAQLRIVQRLLTAKVPECEVSVFGSRVTTHAKPDSDLDIVLRGPTRLTPAQLVDLRAAFVAQPQLPIHVDVVDWRAISENFRHIIAAKFEVIQNPVLADEASEQLVQAIKANLREQGCLG
ncbi:MAG: nucleotidyltransferase domain-containing protein [Verrucomicrobia bacterium]|nr:MAG: nucleotidyltransferase domain-containing protein [Verrucomicrobiota bacterium]